MKIYFQRFVEGAPNLIELPIVPYNTKFNGYDFIHNQFIYTIWVWCYDSNYPSGIDVNALTALLTPNFCLATLEEILPPNVFLHDKHRFESNEPIFEFEEFVSESNKQTVRRQCSALQELYNNITNGTLIEEARFLLKELDDEKKAKKYERYAQIFRACLEMYDERRKNIIELLIGPPEKEEESKPKEEVNKEQVVKVEKHDVSIEEEKEIEKKEIEKKEKRRNIKKVKKKSWLSKEVQEKFNAIKRESIEARKNRNKLSDRTKKSLEERSLKKSTTDEAKEESKELEEKKPTLRSKTPPDERMEKLTDLLDTIDNNRKDVKIEPKATEAKQEVKQNTKPKKKSGNNKGGLE